MDTFEPHGDERNSSSVVDLFYSLDSPINFFIDLEWPDPYQEARFATSLAKVQLLLPCHASGKMGLFTVYTTDR